VLTQERAAEAVDPRILARRDEVDRQRHRRRRRWVVGFLVAASLLVGAWYLTRTAVLDVDRIRVSGSVHTSEDDLITTSGLRPGEQLLDVDPGAIADRVRALPWVDDVSVTRSWRGDVEIAVSERVPVAVIADTGGQPMLVDATGRVVAPVGSSDPGLLLIEGLRAGAAGDQVADVEGPLDVVAAMTPGLRTRIETLVVGTDGRIELRVRPSGVVRFCGPDRIVDKIRALQTVFAQVDDRGLATLDVCVPEQPTIGPRTS
jgi:cell division protein FtsQ